MQEFSVQTSNLNAELGGASGVESLTMKSGANQIHGNLYEFHRDDDLNAKGFNPVPVKALFIQNEYGGSVGGPISIPHVYNGHNRTFFFVTFGEFRNIGGPPNAPVYTVPTAAMHQGDFSQELAVLGTKIYNPATTTLVGSSYTRTAFANNMVGPIVPQAAFWLKYIALPNLPGTNSGLTSNFQDTNATMLHDNTYSAKIDHSFNDRHKIAYSYWGADRPNLSIADVYFSVPISPGAFWGGGQRLHDYYSFSTNIQNDAYAGISSYYQRSGVCAAGSQLGDNPSGIPNLDYYNPGGTGQFRFSNGYFRLAHASRESWEGRLDPRSHRGGGIVGLGQQRSVSGKVTDRKLILVIVVAGEVISLVAHVRGLDKEAGGKVTLNPKRPLLKIGIMACSHVPKQGGAAIDEIGVGAW